MDIVVVVGSVAALGIVAGLVVWRQPLLAFVQRSTAYIEDVRAEVRKVSWPTWDDLRKSTLVIIIIVLIVGAIIGIMDRVFSMLLIDFLDRIFGR